MERVKNRNGQITMYVIIAILIVIAISLIFVLTKGPSQIIGDETNPGNFIEQEARKSVNEVVDIMLPQGGFVNVTNYEMYKNNKVAYICKNIGFYDPCINQHPVYLDEIKKEIKNYVEPRVEKAFQDMKKEFEDKNYKVEMGEMNLSINLGPKKVLVNIQREIVLTKGEEARRFREFNVIIVNPVYDLARVVTEVASQEAKYCYFEYVGYMLSYNWVDIRKVSLSDPVRIYTIKDKQSGKEINVAIRGCAIPGGL